MYYLTVKEIEKRIMGMTFKNLKGGQEFKSSDTPLGKKQKKVFTRIPCENALQIQLVRQVGKYTEVWLNNNVRIKIRNF